MEKRMALTVLIAASLFLCSGIVLAGVQGGPHDFTQGNGGTYQGSNDQVCIYCHTPHNAVITDRFGVVRAPLWNRSLNEGASGFTMYTSSVFGTLPGMDTKPTGNTLLCLSCHDGISSLGGVINNGGTPITFNFNAIGDVLHDPANPNDPITKIIIGRDLSNDHPVSFTYNNTLDPVGLKDPGDATGSLISPLRLYNQRMECCTCHDPHEIGSTTGKFPFLRVGNAGSTLCLTCHNK